MNTYPMDVRIKRVRYSPNEKNWVALKVGGIDKYSSTFCATGTVLIAHRDLIHNVLDITINGRFEYIPPYGKTFSCGSIQLIKPGDILAHLTKVVKVGKTVSTNMIKMFGADLPRIITQEPQKLMAITGVGKTKMNKIVAGWNLHEPIRLLADLLLPLGISATTVDRARAVLGDFAAEIIRENPYLLTTVPGMHFKAAARVAILLGHPADSPHRFHYACLCAYQNEAGPDGNATVLMDQLIAAAINIAPGLDEIVVKKTINELCKSGEVVVQKPVMGPIKKRVNLLRLTVFAGVACWFLLTRKALNSRYHF